MIILHLSCLVVTMISYLNTKFVKTPGNKSLKSGLKFLPRSDFWGSERFLFVIEWMTHVTANRNQEFRIHLVPMHVPLTRTRNCARRETGESVAMEQPRDIVPHMWIVIMTYPYICILFYLFFFSQHFWGKHTLTLANHEPSVGNYYFSPPSSLTETR